MRILGLGLQRDGEGRREEKEFGFGYGKSLDVECVMRMRVVWGYFGPESARQDMGWTFSVLG